MLRIEVEGNDVRVTVDGVEAGGLILEAVCAVGAMADVIRRHYGLAEAEAFLLYLNNMDKAGAFTVEGGEGE